MPCECCMDACHFSETTSHDTRSRAVSKAAAQQSRALSGFTSALFLKFPRYLYKVPWNRARTRTRDLISSLAAMRASFTTASQNIIFTLYSSPARRLDAAPAHLAQLRSPAEPARPLIPQYVHASSYPLLHWTPGRSLSSPLPLVADSAELRSCDNRYSLGCLLSSHLRPLVTHLHPRQTHSLPRPALAHSAASRSKRYMVHACIAEQ